MTKRRKKYVVLAWIVMIVLLTLTQLACHPHVGVGVSVGFPGPYYGPWGGPRIYIGGPVY
jgi:hypothetical protein